MDCQNEDKKGRDIETNSRAHTVTKLNSTQLIYISGYSLAVFNFSYITIMIIIISI